MQRCKKKKSLQKPNIACEGKQPSALRRLCYTQTRLTAALIFFAKQIDKLTVTDTHLHLHKQASKKASIIILPRKSFCLRSLRQKGFRLEIRTPRRRSEARFLLLPAPGPLKFGLGEGPSPRATAPLSPLSCCLHQPTTPSPPFLPYSLTQPAQKAQALSNRHASRAFAVEVRHWRFGAFSSFGLRHAC